MFSEVLRFKHGGSTAGGMRRSSSTSAATNSSLQICYINDDDVEDDDDDDDHFAMTWDGSTYSDMRRKSAPKRTPLPAPSSERKSDVRKPATQLFAEASCLGIVVDEDEEEDDGQSTNLLGEDRKKDPDDGKKSVREFILQQSQLQAEAKMALAQALPMARMQMELERMNRKKSSIADIVGLQGNFMRGCESRQGG